MGENTPERLKQFREGYAGQRTPRSGWAVACVACAIAGIAAGALAGVWYARQKSESAAEGGLSLERQKALAVRLEEKQLHQAALEAYDRYLGSAVLGDQARAKVCYSAADVAISADDHERALGYLYEAEFLDPDGELSSEIGKKIVACLEKLDRPVDLRRELRQRTSVKHSEKDLQEGEVVLAELGDGIITDRDLELELEKLPAAAQERMATPEQRFELLKNVVAERLLLDKANRLELDQTPEIQEQLAAQRDALVVRKLIADTVRKNVRVTPDDVERFYKAEPDRFTDPARAQVRVAKADTEEAARVLEAFPEQTVTALEGRAIPGVPGSAEASQALFSAPLDESGKGRVGPVEIDGTWYIFQVESRTGKRLLPFEEVKNRAGQMLRMTKEQEQVQALIEDTLAARNVRLYPERLKEADQAP